MSTSQKTFDQVKSILGKLDRSIDAARERRTGHNLPRPLIGDPALASNMSAGPHLGPHTVIGGGAGAASLPAVGPKPAAPASTSFAASPASSSAYGKARPLRPN